MRSRLLGISVFLVASLAVGSGVGGRTAAASGASISGVVYFDTDMDGQRDAGEPPAPGRTVRLIEYTDDGDRPLATAESGTGGQYRFRGLSPSKAYEVGVLTDETTPCVTAGSQTLTPGAEWSGQDLGVLEPGGGRLSGTLVNDVNENGARDAGEPELGGWTVSVGASADDAIVSCNLTTETDADGGFSFEGLLPFKYELGVDIPPAQSGWRWEQTFPTKAAPSESFPDSRDWDNTVDLSQADASGYVEVGMHVLAGNAAIAGSAFIDTDIDGVRDAGEPLLDCTIIQFFLQFRRRVPSVGTFLMPSELSCLDGKFQINGLAAGTYNVGMPWCGVPGSEEHRLQGPSQRSVTLADGQRVEGVDLAVCPVEWPTPSPPVPTGVVTPLPPTPSPQPGNTPASIGLVGAPDTGSGGASDTAGRGSVLAALLALGAAGALAAGSAFAARTRRR